VGNGRKTADSVSAADRREKIKALDRAQLDTLLTVAQHDRLHPLWLFLADTGCGPSEAFAIQWENVDLVARTATIRQALDLDGTTKSTKTKNTRRVDLSARLVAALDAAQLAREAEALASGREANALVFASVFGTPLDIDNVAKIFKRLLVRAGLPKFSLYSLRHSWASYALAAGAPIHAG